MKPHLYVNPEGWPVTRHSYSGSSTFRHCARLYELERIAGWHQKEERAAQFFGTCVETAVRLAHAAADLFLGADFFEDEWRKYETANVTYSKAEGDWAAGLASGREMLRLYAIFYPNTGFSDPEFQVKVVKDIDGIEFMSYLDMIVTRATGTKLILDCKVSGATVPKLVSLDPQLRSYAWVTGIPDVGFLWFEKNGRTIKTGDEVILLSGQNAGSLAWVVSAESDDVFTPSIRVALQPTAVSDIKDYCDTADEKLAEAKKLIKGRKPEDTAAREALTTENLLTKQKFIAENSSVVAVADVTKQRIYLETAEVPEWSRLDIGAQIARDIKNIQQCNQENHFPMESSVRFPSQKCPNCVMRGICTGDNKLRDELVTRGKTLDKKGYDFDWDD